jgi:hypothetical protein
MRLCYAKTPALLHEAMDRLAGFVEAYEEQTDRKTDLP